MSLDLLPPFDEIAEAGALACILATDDGREAEQMLARLSVDDFYDVRHREAFLGLTRLVRDNKPADLVNLTQHLRDTGKTEDAGGLPYVVSLPEQTPSPANFPSFLEVVKDRSIRRAITRDAGELKRLAEDLSIPAKGLANAGRRMGEAYSGSERSGLTIRKPSEFLAMTFDDSDMILGDWLMAGGQPFVMAAAGGTGKSRLLFQAAACIATGRKFLAFETNGENLRWLILQTENSNRRLRDDLTRLRAWLGNDWEKFEERVLIHPVENETDSFVSLDDPENVANIAAVIAKHKPDIIAVDPLNEFAIGDLNKDADMKATLKTLSRICRKGNPDRSIAVLHHAITGRGGAAKATGYDRASFARNSKTLHAWARGQINLAPVDEDSNERLIVACGKCSNGREFPTFAIRLNPETMIYECDPSVDVAQWQQEINGAKPGQLMSPERVRELCCNPLEKPELARAIMKDCGCARGTAYRHMDKAERKKAIHYSKASERYIAK